MEKQTRTFKKVGKEVTFAALKRGCDGLHHRESKQICVFTCNRIFLHYLCKKISDFWVNEKFIMREIIKARVWQTKAFIFFSAEQVTHIPNLTVCTGNALLRIDTSC